MFLRPFVLDGEIAFIVSSGKTVADNGTCSNLNPSIFNVLVRPFVPYTKNLTKSIPLPALKLVQFDHTDDERGFSNRYHPLLTITPDTSIVITLVPSLTETLMSSKLVLSSTRTQALRYQPFDTPVILAAGLYTIPNS